jgi:heat shock protein HtpX
MNDYVARAVQGLKTRINFLSLFGLFFVGFFLFLGYDLLYRSFGELWAGIIIYGVSGVCLLWAFFVSLFSKDILASSMPGLADWFNSKGKYSHREIRGETQAALDAVKEASEKMNIDQPATLIADEGIVNAFMAGIGSRVVVFYRGLLQQLTPGAIRGVAFHEVSHAKNNDLLFSLFVISFIQAFAFLSSIFWQIARFMLYTNNNGKRELDTKKVTGALGGGGSLAYFYSEYLTSDMLVFLFLGVAFSIIANVFGAMIMSLISQNREYLADATSVEHGAGDDLASAFQQMQALKGPGKVKNDTFGLVSKLGITTPKSDFFAPSHPTLKSRIENILALQSGKSVSTAGFFMYTFLCLVVALSWGWIYGVTAEGLTRFLDVPVLYLVIAGYAGMISYSLFQVPNHPEYKEEVGAGTKTMGWIVVIMLVLVLALVSWIVWQVYLLLGLFVAFVLIAVQVSGVALGMMLARNEDWYDKSWIYNTPVLLTYLWVLWMIVG